MTMETRYASSKTKKASQATIEKMKLGLSQVIVVAVAFFTTYLAELSYSSYYYHAFNSLTACVVSLIAIGFAVIHSSKLLLLYATIYVVAACFYSLFYVPTISMYVYHIFYSAEVNFSLIISIADWLIITAGGINVLYRFYNLLRGDSNDDNIFNARVVIR